MTRYFRISDLTASGRVSNRMTAKRWIDQGIFPPPDDLGPNTTAWSDEVLAEYDARVKAGITEPNPEWLAKAAKRKAARLARIAERDATPPKAA